MTIPEKETAVATDSPGAREEKRNRLERLLERPFLLLLVIVCGLVWAFAAIADEVHDRGTQRFDERVLLMLREPGHLDQPIGPKWLEPSILDISALGGWTVLTLVIVGVSGFLLTVRKRRAAFLVLSTCVGGQLVSQVLKHAFSRPRPTVVPHLATVHSFSFPSGHSMMSAIVYLTLCAVTAQFISGWRGRIYVFALGLVLTFVIGLSRLYLGVHYPTDVMGGWCAGLTWAIVCMSLARRLQVRGDVEPPGGNRDAAPSCSSL